MSTRDNVVRRADAGVPDGVAPHSNALIGVGGIETGRGVLVTYATLSFRTGDCNVYAFGISGIAVIELDRQLRACGLVRRWREPLDEPTELDKSSCCSILPTASASDSFNENAHFAGAEAIGEGCGVPFGEAGKSMKVFRTSGPPAQGWVAIMAVGL